MKSCLLLAIAAIVGCSGDNEITPPAIISFSASSTSIASGATVMLTWQVRDAVQIRINAQPGGLVEESTLQSGTVESAALDRTTAFILTAIGEQDLRAQSVVVV